MQRSSYPAGETTTSRIKSLVLYLRKERGRPEADALLGKIQLRYDDLENETRPIGVALWHAAVENFAARYGKEELLATWKGVVESENLGVWMRVLRGTVDPQGAFLQLDGFGGDLVRTTRWETLTSSSGRWHGRIFLSYDPRFEREGLLTLARAAELRAIPVMYGLPPGEVTILSTHRSTFASRTGSAGQEFLVTWRTTHRRLVPLTAALASTVGATGFWSTPTAGFLAILGGALAGATAATLWRRDRERRTEALGQGFRIRALERSMLLREEHALPAGGYREGIVIAGMYRLGPRLGTGASGVIHAALRLSDHTSVAIKLLRAAVAHDAVSSDRLRREAEAMGLAWHPNVVELYDQGVLPDGTNYLVMELLTGESLAARLKRTQGISPEELFPIALELCDALEAIHAAGVIHRDVKPSNIFLATTDPGSGRKERVKLLDFGIARVEWAETRLTNLGVPVGTPGYMSPEQERGGEVDARSDLFAFGAVLYECLTGIFPDFAYHKSHEIDFAARHSSGVQRSTAALPQSWADVIDKAMAPLPHDRFSDAKSMRAALADIGRASGVIIVKFAHEA